MAKLILRREGASGWRMADAATGVEVGCIRYDHARDGNHYRIWLLIEGTEHAFGDPLPQLAMAARAIEDAVRIRQG